MRGRRGEKVKNRHPSGGVDLSGLVARVRD